MQMRQNVGKIDKIIRVVAAGFLAGAGYYFSMWPLYVLSGIMLITAITGFCGLYLPFKISTCPVEKKAQKKKK